jgi:hypothetical protein
MSIQTGVFLLKKMTFLLFTSLFFLLLIGCENNKSISMGGMVIEKKHHYIEPGQYFEMWVIGYNAYEKEGNREHYKIYIQDSMIYNLLEEGEEYMVSAQSFRKDEEFGYAYQLTQISNQEEYQLSGKGRIK